MAGEKNNSVHYEVLGQRGTSWTIIAVVDEQSDAMKRAQEARNTYRAVKVNRERFDATSSTYRSGQIFFSGAQAKASKFDSDDMPSVCWRIEDFYSYEGRRAINRLLRKEMVEWGITATELLHSIDHVQRLQDNGTSMQRAVQQTAIAQVRETGQGVQERIKQIFDLVDKGTVQLRKAVPGFPQIRDDRLDDLIDAINKNENRDQLLQGALTKYLAGSSSFNDKMSKVLGLVRADHPTWVLFIVDNLVAELLSIGNVLNVLVGSRKTVKSEMIAAAMLTVGNADPADELMTPEARMVNRLIAAGKMPSTQQAMNRFLIDRMKGKSLLVEGEILEESDALGEILAVLKRSDGQWIGQVPMVEAIGQRCARWVHPEAISDVLRGATDIGDRYDRLIRLERNIVGNANKRKVGEFIVPLVMSSQSETFLTEEGGPVTQRLKRLFAMQEAALNSALQDIHRNKLAEHLDDLAFKLIKKVRLIERMTEGEGSSVEKCFSLLRMSVEGFFTRGKADTMARHAIRRCLAMPEFAGTFLGNVQTREEKVVKLEALTTLLKQAGIDASESLGTGKQAASA